MVAGGGSADFNPSVPVKIFSAGAAGCVADLVTFPLDTAKVRLQIQGESKPLVRGQRATYRGVFGTIFTIRRTEGARGLYNGLVAGLHRQMSFASVRVGLYDSMKQFYGRGSENAGIAARLLSGCTTGALAVALAQPTDVVKVRFQAQVRLPQGGSTTRYSGTMDAYRTIARDEGVRGLWKGCLPNITRNAIVNCCEMVTYDIIKERILQHKLMTGKLELVQHALPLYCRLRRRVLHHGGGVSGGRDQNALHELGAGPVWRRHQLRLYHAAQRGGHRLL
ncbi:dicarboxylate carrier SLC25A8-like isoform X2 [Phyllopteryx taeniolatus]|uniref:dicarboxylate carrier SLC25A8-like isoform X2 n=1 Tax=Phyllopteryx taeniolatus TaxID=161469 RepID=UPI002AD4CEE4|nr:dicarboxylate carrier SLC25A8-like isoform X2 [Phyllopteryx taeniolatus]